MQETGSQKQDNEEEDSIAQRTITTRWHMPSSCRQTVRSKSPGQLYRFCNIKSIVNLKLNKHTRRRSKWTYSITKTNSEDLFTIEDSGSPMSFLNEKTAEKLRQNDHSAILKLIPPVDAAKNLACFTEKHILPKGQLSIAVESGGWITQSALFIIVDDQKADIMGATFYQKLGSNKP